MNLKVYFAFAGISLVVLIAGLISFINERAAFDEFMVTAIKTEGVIAELYPASQVAYVHFVTEDGREILTDCGYYISSMSIGQQIELYYDPIDPQNISTNSKPMLLLLFIPCIGCIFFIIGIVLIKKKLAPAKPFKQTFHSPNIVRTGFLEFTLYGKPRAFLFIGLGLLLIFVGIATYKIINADFNQFIDTAIKTNGFISDLSLSKELAYVSFTTEDGHEIMAKSNFYSETDMYIGQPVELYYNPTDPQDIRIDSGNFSLIMLLGFNIIGGMFCIVGILALFYPDGLQSKRIR